MTKSDGDIFTGAASPARHRRRLRPADCSTKIVGARYFGDDLAGQVPAGSAPTSCPRATATGTAPTPRSTAAGNAESPAAVDGRDFGKISGVAPAAKIAATRCAGRPASPAPTRPATTGDSLDAIDEAIRTAST